LCFDVVEVERFDAVEVDAGLFFVVVEVDAGLFFVVVEVDAGLFFDVISLANLKKLEAINVKQFD
jgi:hypothetical protein